MPTEFVQAVETVRWALAYVCIAVLALGGVGVALYALRVQIDKVYHDFLHLDGIGRVVVSVCIVAATMYGGAKHAGWNEKQNAGRDNDLGVVGIYSMQTNVVSNAGATTNTMTAVQVKFTGNKVTFNTPFWVRNSTSNDWTRITWENGVITSDLATNQMETITSVDLSQYVYWWLGNNLPAVEVETVGITLLNVVETSTSMGFVFTCDNANARHFKVQYQRGTNTVWNVAAESEAALTNVVQVSGFWIGETTKWRIVSDLEDEEEDDE